MLQQLGEPPRLPPDLERRPSRRAPRHSRRAAPQIFDPRSPGRRPGGASRVPRRGARGTHDPQAGGLEGAVLGCAQPRAPRSRRRSRAPEPRAALTRPGPFRCLCPALPTAPPPTRTQTGLAPALVGSGVSWGAYLYLYERVKGWHRGWQGSERLGPGWNLLSAAQAGAMVRGARVRARSHAARGSAWQRMGGRRRGVQEEGRFGPESPRPKPNTPTLARSPTRPARNPRCAW